MATSSSPPLRSPLSSRTNSPTPRTPSPTNYATAKSTQARPPRRQLSLRTFHPHLDSSESDPSAHSSIFEAFYLTPSAVERLGTDANAIKRASTGRSSGSSEADGNMPMTVVGAARDPWIGTPLETITEQKSVATLRAVASLPQLRSSRDRRFKRTPVKPSTPSLALLTQHKHSFSLDDLPLRPRRRNSTLTRSDSTTASSLPHVHEEHEREHEHEHRYAQPNEPTASPPHRMPTPPGLPSFGTRAAHNYRIEPPPFRLRDLFSRTNAHAHANASAGANTAIQTIGLPRGVVARGPNAVVRARFRPTQSGHTGQFGGPNLASHPFHAAVLAKSPTVGGRRPSLERDRPPAEQPRPARVRREARSARARRQVRFVVSSSSVVVPHAHAEPSATELYHRALSAEPAFRRPVGGGGGGDSGSVVGTPRRGFSSSADADGHAGRRHVRREARSWQEVADRSRWEGFCDLVCVGCCGVEKPATGEEMATPVLPVPMSLPVGGGPGGMMARRVRYASQGLGGYVP